DTTFLIDLFRNDEKALNFLEELNRSGEPVSTTVINMAELYRGAFSHPKTDEKLQEIEDLKDLLVILDMRLESAQYYGKVYADLKEKGKMAKDRDILIASVFLSFGERKIVTRDKEHFVEIDGLNVVTY
ncbi:MAG: type II toxin-antitoxin system VapC family toxin, partial [Archaeoglobaceae archaeon]